VVKAACDVSTSLLEASMLLWNDKLWVRARNLEDEKKSVEQRVVTLGVNRAFDS